MMRSLFLLVTLSLAHSLSFSSVRSAFEHLQASPPSDTVQSLANTRIPRRDGEELLAYTAQPQYGQENKPVLLLIHEFFGLSKSICEKADALSQDLDCVVIAPDTFRGQSSTFIPKCIWLALTTPQERVNDDLDDVVKWASQQNQINVDNLAVMGFCYGGGKAIRYTCQRKPHAATVVYYGSPLLDVEQLAKLKKPVCGVFGAKDVQFSMSLLDSFRQALTDAGVEHDIRVYDNVGHAFWSDMDQVRRGEQPQADAYEQVTSFLKKQFTE